MKVGLYFGSFNPIHIGHIAIANYMYEYSDMDQIWFVISPQNPFKEQTGLLADYHRYELVYRAIEDFPKFRASNVEFSMPKPSYTALTLAQLRDKYPDYDFALIMGSDNLETFPKWKKAEHILDEYYVYVYPRPNHPGGDLINHPRVTVVNAPLMEISASLLRRSIKEGKQLKAFYPPKVWEYIEEMHFYEK